MRANRRRRRRLLCPARAGAPDCRRSTSRFNCPTRRRSMGSKSPGGADWPAQEWWKRYQDPTLDRLIELGGANSPSLASAHARYDPRASRCASRRAESGAHVQANADADRQRLSDNGLFPPQLLGFTWYNQSDLGLQASYTFDWWGKQRDAVRGGDGSSACRASGSQRRRADAGEFHCRYLFWMAVRPKPPDRSRGRRNAPSSCRPR